MSILRVLVVDDDTGYRNICVTDLRHFDSEVLEAGTAEEVLRLAAGDRPDIIVMDAMLPGLDG